MGLFKKKQSKTNFLYTKVLSVNDMLLHNFRYLKYLNFDDIKEAPIDISKATSKEMGEYVANNIKKGTLLYGGNIIILFKFTDNYLSDCAELMSSLTKYSTSCVFRTTSSTTGKLKVLKNKDKDGVTKKIGRDKININYLLLSSDAHGLIQIYKRINSLSNPFLQDISDVIYDNINHVLFTELINDGILQLDRFKSMYSDLFIGRNSYVDDNYDWYIVDYDKIDDILPELPSIFTSLDLAEMITVSFANKDDDSAFASYTLYSIVDTLYNDKCVEMSYLIKAKLIDLLNESKIYYDNIVKGIYAIRDMEILLEPVYNRNEEDDEEVITGREDDSYINEINNSTKYSPLLENQTELVDIDEELSEDDPEYNQVDEELKK